MVKCTECDGNCCKYVTVKIPWPTDNIDFEELKWFLCHENIMVYIDWENDLCVEFRTPCKLQDPKTNRCMAYEKRPKVCAEHNPTECEVNMPGEYYKIKFSSMEGIDIFKKALRYLKRIHKRRTEKSFEKALQHIEKIQKRKDMEKTGKKKRRSKKIRRR